MSPVKGVQAPGTPSADTHKLKEEVHMLQEALDVMQQQADEYEKEITKFKFYSSFYLNSTSNSILCFKKPCHLSENTLKVDILIKR